MKKLVSLFAVAIALLIPGVVSAHVVVKPGEVPAGSFQTFTVSVPNEKDIATTGVKVLIPNNLKHVTPTVKQGWTVTTEKEGQGEDAKILSISWAGNAIAAGFRDDFTFSAQAPAEATELQWKAYQTYEDGQIIAWDLSSDDQPKKADGSPDYSKSGPFSITKVVTEDAAEPLLATESQDNTSRTLSGIAVIVSLLAFGIATRQTKK